MIKIASRAEVLKDVCSIIRDATDRKTLISYSDVMDRLRGLGHRGISRDTIGPIVGKVSAQVSQITSPSIYP